MEKPFDAGALILRMPFHCVAKKIAAKPATAKRAQGANVSIVVFPTFSEELDHGSRGGNPM